MSKRMPLVCGLLLCACLCPLPASADSIRVSFDVTITFTQGDMKQIFGTPVAVGDVLRGSFTFDPAVPDGNSLNDFGAYSARGETMRIDWGSGLTMPMENYFVYDNAFCGPTGPCDAFQGSASTLTFPGFEFMSALVDFRAPGANRSGDGLPQSVSEIATIYNSNQFLFDAILPNQDIPEFTHRLAGSIRVSNDAQPVPEPGTLLLIGSGIAGMMWRRRTRPRGYGRG